MAKELLQRAAKKAAQSALLSLLPDLIEKVDLLAVKMDRLDDRIRALREEVHDEIRILDSKVDSLKQEMLDRFERQLNTINEVAHRVTRVEGKLEGYMEGLRTVIGPVKMLPKRKAS